MSQVDRVGRGASLFPDSMADSDFTKPAGRFERTADGVLAKLQFAGSGDNTLKVEALFKVVEETSEEGATLRLRLRRIWGKGEIETGSILASCEYEPDTFEAPRHRIFLAYQALKSYRVHEYSYTAKVQSVDPMALKRELHSTETEKSGNRLPQIKLLRDLLQSLSPGHLLLAGIKVEKNEFAVDLERVTIVSSASAPVSVGFGLFPEEGSHWGLVGSIAPEGLFEITAEYRVLKSRPTHKNSWVAQLEKTSNDRKILGPTVPTRNSVTGK